ncbi:MAG: tryptophan--tRNA ligase [Cyanobacteria bacterium NC_groundwater_1444_Ag_S-0.65um_54_12]|nr:tryptophan--tRNA ligase [Cyanobacteria bacterium NC_groundwater_1444_Ag_S-0.65um_54_12]
MAKVRVMSGMRPTGPLHLGHLFGVLTNWVRMQEEYDCFFAIADWHALSTGSCDTSQLRNHTLEVLLDWLAAGVDPKKATIFVQSAIPEIAELALLLSMITPLGWLQRNPSVREQIVELQLDEERIGYGLVGYPVLQAADILLFAGERVPVGKDQLPHLELTRDIARRFNRWYGEIFREPEPLLTTTPAVPGIDGRKMSKSYGNTVRLAATSEELENQLMTAITDPGRQRRYDPGYPEICTIFAYWQMHAAPAAQQVALTCRLGTLGCVEDKRNFAAYLGDFLAPLQERREYYAARPDLLEEILQAGNRHARRIAQEMIKRVREAMQLNDFREYGQTPTPAENLG